MAEGMSSEEKNKRAIEDYSQFSQTLRAGTQYVFAANGGAVLAMLTCLTAVVTKEGQVNCVIPHTLIRAFSIGTGCYLTGVLLVIVATFFMSLAKMRWGHFWEDNAITGKIDWKGADALAAKRLEKAGFVFLAVAALMFIPGSIYAIRGFLP